MYLVSLIYIYSAKHTSILEKYTAELLLTNFTLYTATINYIEFVFEVKFTHVSKNHIMKSFKNSEVKINAFSRHWMRERVV
jgi:hypothetical protein